MYKYGNVHGSASHRNQKVEIKQKCPSIDGGINKMSFIHTMEYLLTMKWNKILIHTTTWMNLEPIRPIERSQVQKATLCMVPFIGDVQHRQSHRDRRWIRGFQELGREENWDQLVTGMGFLSGVMKKFQNGLRGWMQNSVNTLRSIELYTLNE